MFNFIVLVSLIGVVSVLVYKANKKHATAAAEKVKQEITDHLKKFN